MKIARLAGLMLVAIFAMSLVAASAASAAGPLFLTSGKPTITGTSTTGVLSTPSAGIKVTCQKDNTTGEVTSTTLAGNVIVHFLECSATKSTEKCTVKSKGAPLENLIITTTLHGILGLVLPKPASGTDAGLLLLPTAGKRFVTLEGSCVPTSAVEGDVAGLIEPVGALSTTGKLVLGVTSAKQNIKEIDLTNSSKVEPELVAFSGTSTEETSEALTFSAKVEVM
jgi:hypothetical protein